jgi:hypothetical protein
MEGGTGLMGKIRRGVYAGGEDLDLKRADLSWKMM